MLKALTDPMPKIWHDKNQPNVNQAQIDFFNEFKFSISKNLLSHDSLFCYLYKGNIKPFPLKRKAEYCLNIDGQYYGCCANIALNDYYNRTNKHEIISHQAYCPNLCRPVNNQDWLYC